MLQTLFYIPRTAFGLPVFGFGILLFVWAFAGSMFMTWLVRKQGWNADTRGYIPVLGLIGAAICFLLPALAEDKGLPIRGYGTMVLIGVAAGIWLAARRAIRANLDPELILSLAFWMFLAGMFGARVFYVIEYWKDQFRMPKDFSKPLDVLATVKALANIAQGGIIVYGAFIGGSLALWLYARRKRMPLLGTFDLIAPSMVLGLAIGRIGCFMNGCCYGGTCERPWAVSFPWNSPPHMRQVMDDIAYIDGLLFAKPTILAGVEAGSEAEQSGLKAGDYLTYMGDTRPGNERAKNIHSTEEARERLHEIAKKGGEIFVLGERDGKFVTYSWMVTAGAGDREFGLEFEKLPVLTKVEPGSEPEKLGLEKGDRITEIGFSSSPTKKPSMQVVTTAVDVKRAMLESTTPNTTVFVKVEGREEPFSWTIVALPGSNLVHPTQLYASIGAVALFLFLLAWYPYRRHDGELLAWMLVIYAVIRFLEESIRTDEGAALGTGLTLSQNLSVLMLVAGIGLWVYLLCYERSRTLNFYSSAGN